MIPIKLRLFLDDPITYLMKGWEYVGMRNYCKNPPCPHAIYCRGSWAAVENCKKGGYQGYRYDTPKQKITEEGENI